MPGSIIRFLFTLLLFSSAQVLMAQTDSLSLDTIGANKIVPLPRPNIPDLHIGIGPDSSKVDTLIDQRIIVTLPDSLLRPKSDSIIKRRWPKAIQTGVNVNQAQFSENWKGGGQSSIAIGLFLNAKLVHETERTSFTNDLQLLYGIVKNEKVRARKNADRIFIDSKFGYKVTDYWNIFFSVNYLSQFDLGYKYSEDSLGAEVRTMISRFMAPGYLTSSFGMEFKPVEYFWIRFGTGTLRQTFVIDTTIYRNENQNYGVPIGKKVRNEIAFQFVANFDKEIAKNFTLKARYMAFANYEDLEALDNRLDISFIAKITKYIDVNLTAALLYDQDMDYKIQYGQQLALGILYSYSEFVDKVTFGKP